MILYLALLAVCVDVIVLAQDIYLNPDATLSFSSDIVGLTEHELGTTLPVDVSFSLGSVAIDLDADSDAVSSGMRLDTLPTLHGEVASLPESALKDDLNQSLAQADAAINAIRDDVSGISIDELYDELKTIEKALDPQFIDLVDDSVDLEPTSKARLLVIAEPIEQRYDYLKYIADKIKSYARDEVKDEFAALLRRIVLDLADGDSASYRTHLGELLSDVDDYRGTMIKEEEADRIRYKADSLLRKIAENGTDRSCNIDLSTSIADIDIDGELTWEDEDYRAPSKDVRTDTYELEANYSDDDWDVSIDYQQEQRDYTDRLKDDDDRIKHRLDVSVSRDLEPYSADLSASYDSEYYPNDIDAEIEVARVTEARVGINDLLNRVFELHLVAALEARLVNDLGEEGALGALAIGDRKEAVDCLDDFIDHLLDAKWDGEIEPVTAQALIATARSIQPRRSIYDIDIPLSLGLPFCDGSATVDIEWESKTYPADSPLDHNTLTAKLSYTKESSALTLSGYLKREELVYPNDAAKNKSLQEWEGSFNKQIACGELALTFFQQQTTYPSSSLKNQSVHKLDLDLNIDLAEASIALQGTDKVTAHPNDASEPIEVVGEVDLAVDLGLAQGTLSASWSDEQEWDTDANLAEKVLVDETRAGEIAWDSEITDDLDISLSAQWTDEVTVQLDEPGEPVEEDTETYIDADFDVTQGTLSVSWSNDREWNADASLAEKVLVKETRQAELSWDGEITDALGITLSYKRKGVTDWADPSEDTSDITLEIGFDLAM